MQKAELKKRVTNVLLLVLDGPLPDLDNLTVHELSQIGKWCAKMHYEASDNPVRARAAPKCLRLLLPKDHYLQTWRRRKHARSRNH